MTIWDQVSLPHEFPPVPEPSARRCPRCQRPMDASTCPRCTGQVEELAQAVLEAADGRATFLECYEFAKTVAAREAGDAAHDHALAAAFAQDDCMIPVLDFTESRGLLSVASRHTYHRGEQCPCIETGQCCALPCSACPCMSWVDHGGHR